MTCRVGDLYTCADCGFEILVVRAPGKAPNLKPLCCCGRPMAPRE